MAWYAAQTSLGAMFQDVYAGSGLDVVEVSGEVLLTIGGGLMVIDYLGTVIHFGEGGAIPNVVINGQLIGSVSSNGSTVSFTGEDGGLTGASTVLGDEIIVPVDAEDLPPGTTEFIFEYDTDGQRLVTTPTGGAADTVWFSQIWLRMY